MPLYWRPFSTYSNHGYEDRYKLGILFMMRTAERYDLTDPYETLEAATNATKQQNTANEAGKGFRENWLQNEMK